MDERVFYQDRFITVTDRRVNFGRHAIPLKDVRIATVVPRRFRGKVELLMLLLFAFGWRHGGSGGCTLMVVVTVAFIGYLRTVHGSAELQLLTPTGRVTGLSGQKRDYLEAVCGHILLASAQAQAQAQGQTRLVFSPNPQTQRGAA